MSGHENLHLIPELTSFNSSWDGETPYAIATVVHTVGLTATKAGARAVVSAAGEIEGLVGGGCLRRAILETAATVISDGRPRFIVIKPRDKLDEPKPSDCDAVFPSSCPSQGEIKLFVEAVLPKPPLLLFGDTEITRCLVELARSIGLKPVVVGSEPHGSGCDVIAADQLATLSGMSKGYAVIATQGLGDRPALKAALATPCTYVLFIASRRKSQHMRDLLSNDGLGQDDLGRVISPAGLDIGARSPSEVAISIIAQIIQLRHSRQERSPSNQANEKDVGEDL